MNSKAQGNVGVAMAVAYYTSQGLEVALPFGDNCRYDLLVERDRKFVRVQCKTSTCLRDGKFQVNMKTHSSRKADGTTKISYLSKDEIDEVFIWCADGSLYILPPEKFHGHGNFTTGPRNSKYKVN